MNEYCLVTNLTSGIVSYRSPGRLIKRIWKKAGDKQKIPFEELEEAVYSSDIRTLFDRGYLFIDDKSVRVRLGLESEDSDLNNSNKLVLTRPQIERMLFDDSFLAFEKKAEMLSDGSKEILIETAIKVDKYAGVDKYDYIRKNFFVDVETIKRQQREEKQGG